VLERSKRLHEATFELSHGPEPREGPYR